MASGTDDTTADANASVRAWLSAWGAEVAAADIAAGRRRFATDLAAFGTFADVVSGRDEVEQHQWSRIWPAIEDFAFQVDEAQIIVSTDALLAVIATTWTSTGVDAAGGRFDRPGRATIVVRRETLTRPWLGVHTHFSLARGVPAATFGTRSAIR